MTATTFLRRPAVIGGQDGLRSFIAVELTVPTIQLRRSSLQLSNGHDL